MAETYEEAQDGYLQAVGSKAWDAGVEAGEWITWGWSQATDTGASIYGSASEWVDDAVYTPSEMMADGRTTIEKGVDGLADSTKEAVAAAAEVAEKVTDGAMDIAKTIPYLIAAVGGLGIFLYFTKGKGRR